MFSEYDRRRGGSEMVVIGIVVLIMLIVGVGYFLKRSEDKLMMKVSVSPVILTKGFAVSPSTLMPMPEPIKPQGNLMYYFLDG